MALTPDPALEAEIARLGDLGLPELRAFWAERLGPVPRHQSADLMRRRIAYELQVRAYGGLKSETRQRLRKLYDAFKAFGKPVIAVHLSNPHQRESFRHQDYVSLVAKGVICGLGATGYVLALEAMAELLSAAKDKPK